MPTTPSNQDNSRGGSHEQHVKTGQQNHKNDEQDSNTRNAGGSRGGSHEQHVKAGQQSHKNDR
jgi:hypothetical protein